MNQQATTEPRQMPRRIEAEAATLGGMMLDCRVIPDVRRLVTVDDFFDTRHGVVFAAMLAVYDADGALDMVTLASAMQASKTIDRVGGIEYLCQLAESVPSATEASRYAFVVRKAANTRRTIEACQKASSGLLRGDVELDDAVAAIESHIDQMRAGQRANDPVLIGDVARDVYEILTNPELAPDAVPSGFYDLDEVLGGGFRPGEFVVIGARPSMGKTALAIDIADHIAAQPDRVSLVFSAEMSKEAIAKRALIKHSTAPSYCVRSSQLRGDDAEQLGYAVEKLAKLRLFIDDTPSPNVSYVAATTHAHTRRHGLPSLVIVDYLQLLTPGNQHSREQQVSEMSRGLKTIARQMRVPVIVLAQLNRSCEAEHRKPRKSDLRDSGGIEQDADVVMFVHREDQYHIGEEGYQPKGTAEIIVDKQRNGPTKAIDLVWDGDRTTFRNKAHQGQPEATQ